MRILHPPALLTSIVLIGCGGTATATSRQTDDASTGNTEASVEVGGASGSSGTSAEGDASFGAGGFTASGGSGGKPSDAESKDGPLESGTSAPLVHCRPGQDDQCPSRSVCVEGCPFGFQSKIPSPGGICSVPGREPCGCGAFDQPCTTPGLHCLYPSCCDFPGICVTPDEETAICKGSDAVRFACGS
jgi:hypothetical protein